MQTLNWKISLLWIARMLVMVLPLCAHAQIEQVTHHATCPGKNNGRVIIRIAANVYPKLNVSLIDGRGIVFVKENVSTRVLEFANLYAGKYTIKLEIPGVTGCRLKEYSDILPTLDLQLNLIELIKPQTSTSADGKITVEGSGGSNYRYRWEDGSTTASRSNLRIGEYTVALTDGTTGCEVIKTFKLETECSSLHVIIDKIIQPKQDNSLDGLIRVNGNKGSNYTFHWNTGESSAEVTQKAAGNYTVEIIDLATGCKASETIQLLSCGTKESITGAFSFGVLSLNKEPIGANEKPPLQLVYFTSTNNEPQPVDNKFSIIWKDNLSGQILSRGSVLKPFLNSTKGITVEISDGCNVFYYEPH